MKTNCNPKISIIMGIYNCAGTLPQAIDSIIQQTYTDWNLILCDDGSTDDTYMVARQYCDRLPNKILLLKNDKNRGLNFTLNRCLEVAKGEYIARMDGDDLCEPNRFAMEVSVLESEPDIAIVSTDMAYFDEKGVWGKISHPIYPQKSDFLNGTPFCHAPCMVRKKAYDAVDGYSVEDRLLRVEDYHLWYKMYLAGYRGKNLHTVPYHMRDDRNAYSRRKFRFRLNEAYVRWLVVRDFRLPFSAYVHILRPIMVGLLPVFLYDFAHKRRLKKLSDENT